jgi:hypothetical protein
VNPADDSSEYHQAEKFYFGNCYRMSLFTTLCFVPGFGKSAAIFCLVSDYVHEVSVCKVVHVIRLWLSQNMNCTSRLAVKGRMVG